MGVGTYAIALGDFILHKNAIHVCLSLIVYSYHKTMQTTASHRFIVSVPAESPCSGTRRQSGHIHWRDLGSHVLTKITVYKNRPE